MIKIDFSTGLVTMDSKGYRVYSFIRRIFPFAFVAISFIVLIIIVVLLTNL